MCCRPHARLTRKGCWTHGVAQQRQTVSSETEPSSAQQTFPLNEPLCSLPFSQVTAILPRLTIWRRRSVFVQTPWFSAAWLFCYGFFAFHTTETRFLGPDGLAGGAIAWKLLIMKRWFAELPSLIINSNTNCLVICVSIAGSVPHNLVLARRPPTRT